jgi:hypothetical protein
MAEYCLTLLCTPDLEERVLDTLLLAEELTIFTSAPAAVHGLAHERLGDTEQVLGRAFATQVQALVPAASCAALLDIIQREFAGANLRYWVTAVQESGVLS